MSYEIRYYVFRRTYYKTPWRSEYMYDHGWTEDLQQAFRIETESVPPMDVTRLEYFEMEEKYSYDLLEVVPTEVSTTRWVLNDYIKLASEWPDDVDKELPGEPPTEDSEKPCWFLPKDQHNAAVKDAFASFEEEEKRIGLYQEQQREFAKAREEVRCDCFRCAAPFSWRSSCLNNDS